MKLKTIIFLIILSTASFAQYANKKSVLGNGGEVIQNSNYKINATVGQSLVGLSSNSSQQMKNGFWYQVKMTLTAVEQFSDNLPKEYRLYQNYPNPFNPSTIIKYSIPTPPQPSPSQGEGVREGFVILKIYNILGQELVTLVNKQQQPGNYEVTFNASELPSGIYLYRIKAGYFSEIKKMVLIK